MAVIKIGYGGDYDWSKGTSVNLQGTATVSPTSDDGYKILSFNSSLIVSTKLWTDLTGWSEGSSANTDSSSDGTTLLQTVSTSAVNGAQSYMNNNTFMASDGTMAFVTKIKLAKPSVSTVATSGLGHYIEFADGVRGHGYSLRSNGTNFNVYSYGGALRNFQCGLIDTRYHIYSIYNSGSANADVFVQSGKEYYTTGSTAGSSSRYVYHSTQQSALIEDLQTNIYVTYGFSSPNIWETTDATWTSTYNDAIYDAGSGKQWEKLDWTAVTDNSTGCVVKARCASTAAGLSSATYETLTSGVDFTTKGQWIQIEVTMSDGSSGQYTPILKDIQMTSEDAPITFIPQIICCN